MHAFSILQRAVARLFLLSLTCLISSCSISELSGLNSDLSFAALPEKTRILGEARPIITFSADEQFEVAAAYAPDQMARYVAIWVSDKLDGALDYIKTASITSVSQHNPKDEPALASSFTKVSDDFVILHYIEDPCERGKCSVHSAAGGSTMEPIVTSIMLAEPGSVIKSAIKVMHLLGIILGLGSATVLDIIILKFLVAGKIKSDHVILVEFLSKIVTVGLVILWISGLSYLFHYAAFTPVNLGNQKIWAKIVIVGLLTVNGYFIHNRVLPLISRQVGSGLFQGLARHECALMLVFGTISATSWYVPLTLGAMPYFNFVVPASAILSAYTLLLIIGIAATQGIVRTIWQEEATPEAHANYEKLLKRVAATVGTKSEGIRAA